MDALGASDGSISQYFFLLWLRVGLMNLKVMSLLVVMLFICSISYSCSSREINISKEMDLELEKQLKILNKPPIKTIQTSEGDIFDCINMYKQPAFDHPLLKNHKLQLRPTSFPAGLLKTHSNVNSVKIRSIGEACPSRTVPIKRTQKEDLIRVRSLAERPPNTDGGVTFPGEHVVDVRMKDLGFLYYGATAYVSIYNLSIAPDQASSTNMWIESGPLEEVSIISTGWKVSQQLNGDGLTRLFTYWTGDGYHKTGCYNTLCPGFVQTNKEVGPNVHFEEASTPGGAQWSIKLLIFQDRTTGNWWLVISEQNIVIGYFPKELFKHLGDGAHHVAWGGISNAGRNGISPPMGNGNKPNGRYEDTCYFRQVHYIDYTNATVELPIKDPTTEYVDKSGCFGLYNDRNRGAHELGYSFMFGGPGGNCGV